MKENLSLTFFDSVSILGLFHIIRLPRLNSLVSHVPDSFDLAFKLRRKKMTIEVKRTAYLFEGCSRPFAGKGIHLVRNQSLKAVKLHRHSKRMCMSRSGMKTGIGVKCQLRKIAPTSCFLFH